MRLFHGSFDPNLLFSAAREAYASYEFDEAADFIRWGAEEGVPLFVHEIEAADGPIVSIADFGEPGSGWGPLKSRHRGARYFEFIHDDGMPVVVSLHPDQDLKIVKTTRIQ